jgi:hypothetical protein
MEKPILDQLFLQPDVLESFEQGRGTEQEARNCCLIFWDQPDEAVVWLGHDDQQWLWKRETGWEPCFFTDHPKTEAAVLANYPGTYRKAFSFIDHEGVAQHLYRKKV